MEGNMKTLIAVLPFFFFSCTTGNESVPPVGTAAYAVTEADTERAWSEIQSIYARESDSYLSSLEPADQEKILADFVATNEDPHELRIRWTTVGTPKYILAPAFRVTGADLGLTGPASTDSVSTAFLERFSALWRTSPMTLSEAAVSHLSFNDVVCSDVTAIEYRQRYNGLPVVDATVRVLLRTSDNSIAGVVGSFSPIEGISTTAALTEAAAREKLFLDDNETAGQARLVIWSGHMSGDPGDPRLAWQFPVQDVGGWILRLVWIDAADGTIISSRDVISFLKRSLWDRQGLTGYYYDTCTNWGDHYPPPPNQNCWTRCSGLDPELCACPCRAGETGRGIGS
jgi:hypothetical protein